MQERIATRAEALALKYVPHVIRMIFFVRMRKVDFPHTSSGKLTFRTQNDTDKANFRFTADKKLYKTLV